MATLPAQTRRFKLRISAILCKNSSDLFLDTKGVRSGQRAHLRGYAREVNRAAVCGKTARTVGRGGAGRMPMEGYSGTVYRKGQPQLWPS